MKNIAGNKTDNHRVLDALDWSILRELQLNARMSLAELGRKLGRTRARIQQRVFRLEETGVIRGYWTQVDPSALGLHVTAFIHLTIDASRLQEFADALNKRSEIIEWYVTQSEPRSCVLKIHTASIPPLQHFLDFLASYGTPSVTLVLSSPVELRAIEP